MTLAITKQAMIDWILQIAILCIIWCARKVPFHKLGHILKAKQSMLQWKKTHAIISNNYVTEFYNKQSLAIRTATTIIRSYYYYHMHNHYYLMLNHNKYKEQLGITETREVPFTCRYTSGHLIPNSIYIAKG